MKARPLYVTSLMIGLLPMLTGTIIFWTWFYNPKWNDLELWGIRTIMISIPVCITGLVLALIYRKKNKLDFKSKRKATPVIFLTLANIPLAIFYVWFAIYIMDTERITINNNSDSDIKDIHIFGVGNSHKIDEIKKGKSRTVWIHMKHEGLIKMEYTQNRRIDTAYLSGYTGPLMGGNRSEYNIKWTKEDLINKFGS